MKSLPKLLLAVCFSYTQWPCAFAADGNAIGMVLDLQGPVQATEGGVTGKLQLLVSLSPQMRIELPAGSRASLTLYATRSVYRLSGPTVVQVARDGLAVVQGNPPEVKAMGEKLVAAAPAADYLVAGAYRMRSLHVAPRVVLTAPESGTVLLNTRPEFRWEAAEPAEYALVLRAESGGLSYNALVKGKAWSLPEGVQLEHGKTYEWRVTYVSPSTGEAQGAGGKFTLATQADAEQLVALRPAEADPIEDWVFYAAMLQRRQVRAEARSAWKRIAAKRPDLERAVELAK